MPLSAFGRTLRYYLKDGLNEIGLGAILLAAAAVAGAAALAGAALPEWAPGLLLFVGVALLGPVAADFTFLQREAELSNGNLSSHMSRLEEAGYVDVEKRFVDPRPHTVYRLTSRGRRAWKDYRRAMRRLLG